jgi:hypothetical protein
MDRDTNQEKTRWNRHGKLIQKDDGKYVVKLDNLPIFTDPDSAGWIQVFEPRDENKTSEGGFRGKQGKSEPDVPF